MNQSLALDLLKAWNNIFLTGQAGSWKTYVINQYVQWCRACGLRVAITASTGIAATHIGGVTLHSRSGIGIKEMLTDNDMQLIQQKEHLHKQINAVHVLIIDEISMITAHTLDSVDRVVQMMRRDGRPMGGLQVIVVGDFFQLPPVTPRNPDGSESTKRFAFAANVWKNLDLKICSLHTQWRQEVGQFGTILNELRKGVVTEESLELLRSRKQAHLKHEAPTRLYTHNIDVDRVNAEQLAALPGEAHLFTSRGSWEKALVEAMKKSMLAPHHLDLKVWARVLFVKNNPQKGYFNGTTGTVVKFDAVDWFPLVEIEDGRFIKAEPEIWAVENAHEIVASVKQVPLKLARAITVHKSQGMTLDAAEMDLSNVFEPGQAYVALSRLRSLEWLRLLGLNEQWLNAHPLVLRADVYFEQQSAILDEQFGSLERTDRDVLSQRFVSLLGWNWVIEEERKTKEMKEMKGKWWTRWGAHKWDTVRQTMELIKAGKALAEIVAERGLVESTILNHIFQIHTLYPEVSLNAFKPSPTVLGRIQKALETLKSNPDAWHEGGNVKLKSLFDALGGSVEYSQLKLALVFVG